MQLDPTPMDGWQTGKDQGDYILEQLVHNNKGGDWKFDKVIWSHNT